MFNIRKITCVNYDRYKILNKTRQKKSEIVNIYNEEHKGG